MKFKVFNSGALLGVKNVESAINKWLEDENPEIISTQTCKGAYDDLVVTFLYREK